MQQNTTRNFFKYVSLNIAGMLGLSCYILADTFFVAQGVGANGLAALNLAIPVYSFLHGVGLMIGMGGATRFSISRSDKSFTQALYCALLAAVVFLAAGLFFPEALARLLGADSVTLGYARDYLQTILCFAPLFLLNNVMICFVRNDGAPGLAMTAMLVGSFSNIVLDYVFIFPFGMGMFGAALATGIAPAVSLLLLSAHFVRRRASFGVRCMALQLRAAADIAALGASSLVTEAASGVVMIVFNFLLLGLAGNTGVAAYGVVANLALVVVSMFTGIAQGMQPLVSRCHGTGDSAGRRRVLRLGCATAVALALAVYAVAFLGADAIVAAFNRDGDAQLAAIAVEGLRIYFAAFAFAGANVVCAAYFCASDRPRDGFILSMLRGLVVLVPVAMLLSAWLGLRGVWLAMPLTEAAVCACVCANACRKKNRRKKKE